MWTREGPWAIIRRGTGTNYRQQEAVLFVLWPTLFLECHKITTECFWFFIFWIFATSKELIKNFNFSLYTFIDISKLFSHTSFSMFYNFLTLFFYSWHIDIAFYKRNLRLVNSWNIWILLLSLLWMSIDTLCLTRLLRSRYPQPLLCFWPQSSWHNWCHYSFIYMYLPASRSPLGPCVGPEVQSHTECFENIKYIHSPL